MKKPTSFPRRDFLIRSGALAAAGALGCGVRPRAARAGFGVIASDAARPRAAQGLQIGDVLGDRAIVWSRADRAARLVVEWDVSPHFGNPRRVEGPEALPESDYTARVDLTGLPRDRPIFVRAQFAALAAPRRVR